MAQAVRCYRLHDIEIHVAECCVRRQGKERSVRPQTFGLLLYLLQHPERVLTRDELMQAIWAETAVTDNALDQCITEIRRLLDDNPRAPRYLKTVPRKGYLLMVRPEVEIPVTANEQELAIELAIDRVFPTPGKARRVQVALGSVVVLAFLLLVTRWGLPWRPLGSDSRSLVVAVLSFQNISYSDSLGWLSDGLAEMLVTDLARSRNLSLLSREQANDSVETAPGQNRPEGLARIETDILVTGSFAQLGDRIRVDARLQDVASGRVIASESLLAVRPEDLLAQVSVISLKLAAHLDPDGIRGPTLGEVVTTELDAFRFYTLGLEQAYAYHSEEAIQLLKEALEVDPNFAMAHARIGYVYAIVWNNARELARPHLARARALEQRLTHRDRLYLKAWEAVANYQNQAAIEAYQAIILDYPLEMEAYRRLGRLLTGVGRGEEARQLYRRALAIDPTATLIYNALGLVSQGEEAVSAHRMYVALAPKEPNAYDSLALSQIGAGDYSGAEASLKHALELQSDFHFAVFHLGDVYFLTSRIAEAIEHYRRYLVVAPSDWDRSQGYHRLVNLYVGEGDIEAAENAAGSEAQAGTDFGGRLLVALARKDLTTSKRLLEELEAKSAYTEEETFPPDRLNYFRGLVFLLQGETEAGLRALRQAVRGPGESWNVDTARHFHAKALLELGRYQEARDAFRLLVEEQPRFPWALQGLASSLRALDQRDEALRFEAQLAGILGTVTQ